MPTNPVVVFPDGRTLAIDYLLSELAERGDDTPVSSDTPDPRPDRFVTVKTTGGAVGSIVSDRQVLTFESWDQSDIDAHDRAQLCRALITALRGGTPNGVPVYQVSIVGGVVPLPDLSEQPRWTFTAEISLRGTAA